jgi:hypothetical protein
MAFQIFHHLLHDISPNANMAQQLSETEADLLQGSQILELPDLFDLIKVSNVDDFGDDASFTMEDLMDMGNKVNDDTTFKKDANTRSHDKFVLGREEQKKYQKYLASCPEINDFETTTTDSPRKHRSSKKIKRTREAPSRTVSCNAADQRYNALVRPKREPRQGRTPPSRSISCIAMVQTGEVKKTTLSRQKKERRESHNDQLHSSVPLHSSWSRIDFEKDGDHRKRRGSSINAHQVEFGTNFSSIAHASAGLHKKIDKNDESFSDVLDKVAKWKKTTKRDDRLSMRASRSIDILEEEEDVKKVSEEEVSALKENTKRAETAPARRERSSRKERSVEPAEIPFESKYRRKKSLRNMGGSLRNIFARSSDDPNRKKMSFRNKSGSSRNLRTSKPTSSKADQPPEPLPPKQEELDNYLGQAFMRHISRQLSKSRSAF